MNQLIIDKIKELEDRIEQVKLLDSDLSILSNILPENVSIWLDADINVSFSAKSMKELKEILGKLAKVGILIDYFGETATSVYWKLKGKHSKIYLNPYFPIGDDKDAVCKLIQVGVTTSPKYKLVCEEEHE